jgi:hypothetical protein
MSIIDKARADRRIAALLQRVQQRVKLKFEKSSGTDWLSSVEGDRAVIEYAGCAHPSAALAQELLQIDMQLSGYRPIRLGISSVFEIDAMPNFINVLEHELQRHKYYRAFLALGFQTEQFYREADKITSPYLTRVLATPPEKLSDVIPSFLMLIAPGGTMTLDTYQGLYDRFLALNNRTYTKQLLTIEQLFQDWGASDSLDQTLTVKKIMLTIEPKGNFSWFGFKDETGFPDDGFFVDEVFSVRVVPS